MNKRCKECSLPVNFPGLSFTKDGICNLCVEFDFDQFLDDKTKAKSELDYIIQVSKELSSEFKSSYDVVVALSGGKDSCHTLMMLSETYGLKCLAITIDNGFLSAQSIKNSRMICDKYGTDFILFKPKSKSLHKMYIDSIDGKYTKNEATITRASDLCNNCINLINTIVLKEALNRNIPLIAGGYIAGQIPRDSCVLKLRVETLSLFSETKNFPLSFKNYKLTKNDFNNYQISKSVNIINPMLSFVYNENHIINNLTQMGWKRSNDTGLHSSNCLINDLGIKSHLKRYSFHPYESEVAEQVRSGSLSRKEAIEKLETPVDEKRIKAIDDALRSNGK